MHAQFEFEVDPTRDLVRTRLSGFFTPELITAYMDARAEAFTKLRCPVNEHLALTDLREMKIQSQDIVAAFASVLANPATQARRLAFIVSTTLTRTQVQRAIGGRDARWFTDPVEAKAWLLKDVRRAQPVQSEASPTCWADQVTKARTAALPARRAEQGIPQT